MNNRLFGFFLILPALGMAMIGAYFGSEVCKVLLIMVFGVAAIIGTFMLLLGEDLK